MCNFAKHSASVLFRDEKCLVLIHPSERVEFEEF